MDRIAELLEGAEAEAVWGYQTVAPPAVAEALGLASRRLGGGVVLAMRHDVTDYWSKALGFGFAAPVTAGLVEEIADFYREQGVRQATLQFAPSVLPADWDAICEKVGLTAGGEWVKLARLAGLVESAETDLRIAPVEPVDAAEWAAVLVRGFGMPVELIAPMVEGLVGQPGWTAYGAWDGDTLVGAAGLLLHGQVAEFAGAATLPEYRRRGAQSALLAARARHAAAEGAKWLSAETGKPAPGERNSSLENMLHTGFEIRYTRRNWIWRPAD
ncbi:GCN5-related N-acetyltransferase [Kribbella flavida DSM 17836]|uniref:GCN5-related N-acetyltransferase n=1 Tax=Kribbella flavida (strain DSM 17836 / JCM 10339 / NBRC 14399) TaxID=479435 RepID=D2Q4E9_KRIFD|nr:GNAT family N-acetyltransferase [Kribbella flavida]ADB32263.1 GCN5-related N-acetyltransferase [Kribbella flavida DSM 17836]